MGKGFDILGPFDVCIVKAELAGSIMAAHHWITWANVCGVLKRVWIQHSSVSVGQESPLEDPFPLFQACFSLAEGCGTLESRFWYQISASWFQAICQDTDVSLFIFTESKHCYLHPQREKKHHNQVQFMRGLTEFLLNHIGYQCSASDLGGLQAFSGCGCHLWGVWLGGMVC